MNLDDPICLCFRVSRRKLINFVKRERPKVPSQLSECGGAGTGCGWCIPFLKQIHRTISVPDATAELEQLSPEEYARRRAAYVRSGGGTPPAGAEVLPDAESSPGASTSG